MALSKQDKQKLEKFLSDLDKYITGITTEFPSNIKELEIHDLVLQSSLDKEGQELIDILCEQFQIAKIRKLQLQGKSKSAQVLFHGVKSQLGPLVEIEHQKNLLLLAKQQYDHLTAGMDAIKEGVNVTKNGIVSGAKVTGKGLSVASKTVGKGALLAGKGIAASAAFVGGSIAAGAEAAWEHVIIPAGDAIGVAIDQAITAVRDVVKKENLKDANIAIQEIKRRANEVLYHSLKATELAIKLLHPDWDKEDIAHEAKTLLDYYEIEKSLDNLRLDRNLNIEDLRNNISIIKEKIDSVVEESGKTVADAQGFLQKDFTKEQENSWLTESFADFKSMDEFKKDIKKLQDTVATKPNFDSWTEKTKELYLTSKSNIENMLSKSIELCRQNNDQFHLKNLIKFKNMLNEQAENLDIPETLKLLNEVITPIAEVDLLEKDREQGTLNHQLLEAQSYLNNAQQSQQDLQKPFKKAKNALKAADNFVVGVLRLGEKGLTHILSKIKTTMNNIWKSVTEIISGSPNLAGAAVNKLLDFTSKVTEKLSEVSENFVESMYRIIGIKKDKENPKAIYQHQAFQPQHIRSLVNERFVAQDMFSVDDYVIAKNHDETKPYPYPITVKLECKDSKHGNKNVSCEVEVMVFNKNSIDISAAPDLVEKGYIIPASQMRKFENIQQQLVSIIASDPRGLSNMPRAKSINLVRFDDKHYMETFLESSVIESQKTKLKLDPSSKLSPEIHNKFKAKIQENTRSTNPFDSDEFNRGGLNKRIWDMPS